MNALAPPIRNPTRPPRPLRLVGFADWLARGIVAVRAIGPYAAIEILLPGGTLLALLLWLYRKHQRGESLQPVIARSLSTMRLSVRHMIEAARSVGHWQRLAPRSVLQ